jgi:PAS domain S-box-containing protein
MERKIPQLPPTASLATAVAHMLEHQVDYLIITEGTQPLGILTERDIPRLLTTCPQPEQMLLSEAMSSPILSISVDESVTAALELMNHHHLRHIPVVDGAGRLTGVVSQHRLFEQLALHQLESALYTADKERQNRRLETHLHQALQAAGAGVWEYHHDTDQHEISDGCSALLGYAPGDGPQGRQSWLSFVHPDDLPQLNATVHGLETAKTVHSAVEYRMRHHNGSWIWVEVLYGCGQDGHGIVLDLQRVLRVTSMDKAVAVLLRLELHGRPLTGVHPVLLPLKKGVIQLVLNDGASFLVDHSDDLRLLISNCDDLVSQSVSLIFPCASVMVAEVTIGLKPPIDCDSVWHVVILTNLPQALSLCYARTDDVRYLLGEG